MGDWTYPSHFTAQAKAFRRSESGLAVRHFADKALPQMRQTATAKGYTLAVHGSMERDLDLIAVPWRADACEANELIVAIKEATGWGNWNGETTAKPHGRVAVTITGSFQVTVDLSVMPRTPDETPRSDVGGGK